MQIFEIKTNKDDYPFIVIANGFKRALDILYGRGIYDSNIISVKQLEDYSGDHILIEDKLTTKAELEQEVRCELAKIMPHWKKMCGVAGGSDRDTYLIRSSKGHYFTSSCCGGNNYYLELDSLEQLPGINEED